MAKKQKDTPAKKTLITRKKDLKNTEKPKSAKKIKPKAKPKGTSGAGKALKQKKVSGRVKPQNKPSPLDKKIREIKKSLMSQRKTLIAEAAAALNLLPGQTIFADLGDQATAEIDRNFMLRLREREQRLLLKIDAAIEKIDKGVFGVCEVCGQQIGLKRLEARPVTTMCIACKIEQEEEEKLRGRGEY